MKKDNRGLSMIEVIIVLAIMSVLMGAAGFGIGIISRKPVDKCANKLKIAMQNIRTTTMGKNDAKLEFYTAPDGSIMMKEFVNGVQNSTVQIGDRGVTVEYRLNVDAPGTYRTLGSESAPLKISFDRSSGAFKPVFDDGVSKHYCVEIRVSKGTRVLTLKLSYLTGKISMD